MWMCEGLHLSCVWPKGLPVVDSDYEVRNDERHHVDVRGPPSELRRRASSRSLLPLQNDDGDDQRVEKDGDPG